MTFLLTGATGFIGRKLVAHLLTQGHSVNYLARKRSKDLDSRAAFHIWNPLEIPQLESVPRLDAVINLAGEPIAQRWSADVKKRIYESRVLGTRRLVAAIRNLKHKPATLVSASAIGYYGNRGDDILTETSEPGTGFLAELCVAWEREAAVASTVGLRVLPIRIATVLGREGGALPQMRSAFRAGLGGRFGSGLQWMSWIHIDDLVRLISFAAGNATLAGPVNGASPQPVTNNAFTQALGRALHRPAYWTIPRFLLELLRGEMASFLFESVRVQPEAAARAGFQFQYPALNEALRNLCR